MFCISEILAVYHYTFIWLKVTASNPSYDMCCRPYATSVRTAFYVSRHSTDMFKIGLIQILFGAGSSDTDILHSPAKFCSMS
jgi:hypothetical protein